MYKSLNNEFYQNLGKLFYAIAASDKTVREEEYNALKTLVRSKWLTVDETEDESKTDVAYQLEIVFDWLTTKELDANSCYEEFISYKKEHEYFFTDELKSLILKTAGTIATSFSNLNKSELIMLAKLNLELKKM